MRNWDWNTLSRHWNLWKILIILEIKKYCEREREGDSTVPDGWDSQDVPLDGLVELGEVDADLDDGVVLHLVDVSKVDLQHQTPPVDVDQPQLPRPP